jgi:hypothetical protein
MATFKVVLSVVAFTDSEGRNMYSVHITYPRADGKGEKPPSHALFSVATEIEDTTKLPLAFKFLARVCRERGINPADIHGLSVYLQ